MPKKWYEREIVIASLFVIVSRLTYLVPMWIWNRMHENGDNLVNLLNTWDAGWYRYIVINGYMYEPFVQPRGDGANWAFFPLYPLSVRAFTGLTGMDVETAGVILSTLFLIVAIYFAMKYLKLTRKSSNAPVAIAFLLAFGPYSFYFSSLYTEALFIMLAALSFYFMEKNNWLACGLAGALLSAVRPTGVLIVIAVLIKIVLLHREQEKPLIRLIPEIINDHRKLFCLAVIPAGLAAYMTFLYFYVGDPLAFQRIQIAWFRVTTNPLAVLYSGFSGSARDIYLAAWGLGGLALSGYLMWTKRYAEGVFGFLIMIIPMSTALMSLPRFFAGSLVLWFGFNDFITERIPRGYWIIYVALALLNFYLLFGWFATDPLLM